MTDGQATHSATPDWLNSSAIAVVGGKGSGKTCLSYSLLDQMDKPVWVFANPRPDLIQERGWRVMHRLEHLYELDNCAVWCDEIQLTIPTADKRANEGLQKILTIARHRNITLLISTCDTRWVTRSLEAAIDAWCVKDCEVGLVKRGSLIHKIVKKYVVIDPEQFHLRKDQYLFYGRAWPSLDGLHEFDAPAYFSESHSKPYSLDLGSADELRTNCAATAPEVSPLIVANGNGRVASRP